MQSTDALCHPMPGSKMSNVTVRVSVEEKVQKEVIPDHVGPLNLPTMEIFAIT